MAYKFNLRTRRLDNGLTLLVSENRRLPLLSLNAFVLAGADQNPAEKPGLAELTCRLLDEGSASFTADQISAMIESEGGSLSIASTKELTSLCFHGRAQSLSLGLDFLYEMLVQPTFPASSFDLEREKLLTDLKALEDEPQAVAGKIFHRHIYRGCPFQHPLSGTVESVRKLHREDVAAFHRAKYGPRNTFLVVAGDVEADRVEEAVGSRFDQWRNPGLGLVPMTLPQKQGAPEFEHFEMDSEQLQIVLGHLGITRNDPDFHALQVLDIILGSGPGFTSRIPRVLRDQLGLAYLTYSSITHSAGIYPGSFVAFISTSPRNRSCALERIVAEIESIRAGEFSDEELETARSFLTGNFVFDFESNYNVARFLLSSELHQLGVDYPKLYPDIIRSVTREDVVQAADRHLDPAKCTTVIVGPGQST